MAKQLAHGGPAAQWQSWCLHLGLSPFKGDPYFAFALCPLTSELSIFTSLVHSPNLQAPVVRLGSDVDSHGVLRPGRGRVQGAEQN